MPWLVSHGWLAAYSENVGDLVTELAKAFAKGCCKKKVVLSVAAERLRKEVIKFIFLLS